MPDGQRSCLHWRLLSVAEVQAESARAAIRRIGDIGGWRAIECGCGPLGCLAVLSELVGPAGTVVGVDFSQATVERARSVLALLGIGNAEVVAGDVHEFDAVGPGGPFDLGYTRAFLMHQADPERTLRTIAGMLRPGGWLIVQEPLRTPPPQSYPHVGAVGRYWELMHEAAAKSGVAPDAIENLGVSAVRVGFEVAAANGFFNVMEPSVGFDIHASAVAALKSRLVGTGVAAGSEVDELERSLRQAASVDNGWLTSPFMLDLTLRKPL
ncbi:MAG TPA: class I SAM-dependent methyltransferase [Streptosporangiaceae bacterium]